MQPMRLVLVAALGLQAKTLPGLPQPVLEPAI
jgi:hypothetical protein